MIDFTKTSQDLIDHNKTFLNRKKQFCFQWGLTIEENIAIIKRGYEFCDPDSFSKSEFHASSEVEEYAKWMTNTNGKGLALIGASGRGKTLFMHGVLPHLLICKHKVPNTVKATDLQAGIREHIMLIDEVGREDLIFDKERGKIDRFPLYVDMCADKGLPLFFTSNLTQKQFVTRYGSHIMNRVISICNLVISKGESYW